MKEWIERQMNRSAVAHAISANTRYFSRLGPQFAAGITYFSVLSMVPILMFTFAALGMTMTVLRPDLMDDVLSLIEQVLADQQLSATVGTVITEAFSQWASVGGFALVAAVYSGSKWAGNLKRAVRVMWTQEFEDAARRKNFFVELGVNLGIFLGLLISIGFGVGLATISGSFSVNVLEWLGWSHIPGIGTLLTVLTIVFTFVACWILMAFLFVVLPNESARPRPWLVGTVIGAVALTVLIQIAGRLMGVFDMNSAVTIFGPVIVVMLMFNVIASTILMSAAWVGSSDDWREERAKRIADQEARKQGMAGGEVAAGASAGASDGPSEPEGVADDGRWAARKPLDELRGLNQSLPPIDGDSYVRTAVAARGMRVNLRLGYSVGAATGLGLGALIVSAARRLSRRPR
uniref:YihY/virulence factor BrkB family protein n=1 Tax=Tessaracoccus bendigoensis TaxID=72764 RepID=UPI0015880E80|nr:YhjD/YihY/BrkB family envelope integrity protein [Tessaracoccus bendigoensis]